MNEQMIEQMFVYYNEYLLLPPANEVCEGYAFTRVCHSVQVVGGLPQSMLGYHTPSPRDQASSRTRYPPGPGTPPRTRQPLESRPSPPGSRHPCWEQTPLWDQAPPHQAPLLGADTPLGPGSPPPHSDCWEIRSTSGWYASYWNAILCCKRDPLCNLLNHNSC